ncbi:MAG: hypothetical protein AAB225_14405 [Acidobacteriota bacterium]
MRIFCQFLRSMLNVLPVLAAALSSVLKSRDSLQLENLALRHNGLCKLRDLKRIECFDPTGSPSVQ